MEAMPGNPLPAPAKTDPLPFPVLARALYTQIECVNHSLLLPLPPPPCHGGLWTGKAALEQAGTAWRCARLRQKSPFRLKTPWTEML